MRTRYCHDVPRSSNARGKCGPVIRDISPPSVEAAKSEVISHSRRRKSGPAVRMIALHINESPHLTIACPINICRISCNLYHFLVSSSQHVPAKDLAVQIPMLANHLVSQPSKEAKVWPDCRGADRCRGCSMFLSWQVTPESGVGTLSGEARKRPTGLFRAP